MSEMVPMYGFGGGSGGKGAALTVTAPVGSTVTVSKDETVSHGAQLFDISDEMAFTNCSIIANDIIEINADNSGNDSLAYANFFTNTSGLLDNSRVYAIIVEVLECSGIKLIYATESSINSSLSMGQFATDAVIPRPSKGIYVLQSTTRNSFADCKTMCRGFAVIEANSVANAKIRISIIDDLSVTADTFVYRPFTGGTNLRKYSKTKVAGADGVVVFKGLKSGQWTLTITDGEQTAQKTVTITADYTTAITFFAATIHVTYPAGSVCTATDGVTTIHAPDTSGTWDCVVENAGLWTVSLDSGFAETIDVTTSGETYTIGRWYLYNQGDEHEAATGGIESGTYGGSGTKTVTKLEDRIRLYAKYSSGSQSATSCIYTANKIDLTNVPKIVAIVNVANKGQSSAFRVTSNTTSGVVSSVGFSGTLNTDTELSIDTSEISGEYYIGVVVDGGVAQGTGDWYVLSIALAFD